MVQTAPGLVVKSGMLPPMQQHIKNVRVWAVVETLTGTRDPQAQTLRRREVILVADRSLDLRVVDRHWASQRQGLLVDVRV